MKSKKRSRNRSAGQRRRRFVEYRGVRMIQGWPERIQAAQTVRYLMIDGRRFARIRYGAESDDWGADEHACHDCRVIKGELHVPGCDGEECPRCHGQLLTCACVEDLAAFIQGSVASQKSR
jgi:hypothetical protein